MQSKKYTINISQVSQVCSLKVLITGSNNLIICVTSFVKFNEIDRQYFISIQGDG